MVSVYFAINVTDSSADVQYELDHQHFKHSSLTDWPDVFQHHQVKSVKLGLHLSSIGFNELLESQSQ